jgi:hypothetical protein
MTSRNAPFVAKLCLDLQTGFVVTPLRIADWSSAKAVRESIHGYGMLGRVSLSRYVLIFSWIRPNGQEVTALAPMFRREKGETHWFVIDYYEPRLWKDVTSSGDMIDLLKRVQAGEPATVASSRGPRLKFWRAMTN